jgi:hypothetical protein
MPAVMPEREKQSPFGPYRPRREESPFGPRPERKAPRDPFLPPGTEPPVEKPRARPRAPERPLDLFVEVAPGGAAMGHLPRLPGLTFRAGDAEQLGRVARAKAIDYLRWLAGEHLTDLNATTAELEKLVRAGYGEEIRIAERERVPGAPLWISGQPAALFLGDRYALTDDEIAAHLRFMRQVIRRMRLAVAGLAPAERAWKPAPDRRSLDETLTHVGDCIWWYCSRLDDELPEPAAQPDEEPIDRAARRLELAAEFLMSIPLSSRTTIHVPTRFLTADPKEEWTHAKVCRRQSEHAWEHLQGLARAVQMAAEA